MDIPDLKSLQYFLVLAEELHFRKAAERIGIGQPPLSWQIRKLERLVGCPLLIRGRTVELTAAGRTFAEEARRVIAQAEHAMSATRSVAQGETGELRVGVPPSVMLTALPEAVHAYRARYPGIRFTLREMATSEIVRTLRNGDLDIGFLREVLPRPPLTGREFLREPLVAVLPASHPLARKPHLHLRELKRQPFVFFPRHLGPEFYDALMKDCRRAGFTPQIVQEATQWQTVVSFVEAGMGVSIAPASVGKFDSPGVAFRRLPGFLTCTQIVCSKRESTPAKEFQKMAEAIAGTPPPGKPYRIPPHWLPRPLPKSETGD